MGFMDAVKTCFAKFLTLQGRASRPEYWWFFLFVILGGLVAQMIDGLIFGFATEEEPGRHPITLIFWFVTLFPALAAGWRRMHDTGRPGWFMILPTIIVLCAFAGLLLGVLGFGAIEAVGADPVRLHPVAAVVGLTGLYVTYAVILVASILKLWWLTRPGDTSDNHYGPVPTR
ncbi:DUF805 domain-containing protein [Qingshengfaniella alkalisoli]|uniref:DUF805 domain-containing protein n=1 Tax=Qingshengfaniella alkalisoli TaxID=2599296 RepID=A0A5B8IU61_9RHOB|nr:DUF805 domain-containing protein [Qingshengfaniella alkalisoli]QDY68391.1 DUF805 domain-containing protein [Qingshengfaniella alkalisoli]